MGQGMELPHSSRPRKPYICMHRNLLTLAGASSDVCMDVSLSMQD